MCSGELRKENDFAINTLEILDEETENILCEVLKCYVCLELPKGKQVRICEKGHHFCLTCHSNMRFCGICRGLLLPSRNFAVEQLVTRLGAYLEIPNSELPPPEPPADLRPGSYQCPHGCSCKMPAFRVLSHLREKHSSFLVENVRSNPYTGKFSFIYNITFDQNRKHLWSAFVSDMGLFTVDLSFSDLDFLGCVRVLGDETTASLFEQQLVVRVPRRDTKSFLEFSLTESPVSSYADGGNQERAFCIRGKDLLEHIDPGDEIKIFFSVWKKKGKCDGEKRLATSAACIPQRHLFFESDRKSRRNRDRNSRRKRAKERRRELDEVSENLSTIFL